MKSLFASSDILRHASRVRRGPAACIWLSLLSAGPMAQAAETCFVSANPIAFGVYTPTDSAPTDGASSVAVDCQGNKFVPVTISIDAGSGSGASFAGRVMTSTFDTLRYNLYLDSARTIVFGNGSGGSQSVSCTTGATSLPYCNGSNPTGTFRRVEVPFYGRMPALQNVAAGTYTDTIGITVAF